MAFDWTALAMLMLPGTRSGMAKPQHLQIVATHRSFPPPLPQECVNATGTDADDFPLDDAVEDARLKAWESDFISRLEYETGRDLAQWLQSIDENATRNEAIDTLRTEGEFSFRQAAWLVNVHRNDGVPLYADPPETSKQGDPQPVPASIAVRDFVLMMRAEGVKDAAFRRLSERYHDIGAGFGWPALSPKAMGPLLKRHGCRSRVVRQGNARPTVYTIPTERKRRVLA